MNSLIQGSNLTYECEKCQQGVSVQKIFKNQRQFFNKYSFKSVTFHEEKIYALTTEHSINIYQKEIEEVIHNAIVIPIDQNYECFILTYSELLNIILDCYLNQTLFLFSLQDTQLREIYFANSYTPNQTKISSMVKNNLTYIIYGQSFTQFNPTNKNQTILNLTILQEQRRRFYFIAKDNLKDYAETINQTIFIQYYGDIITYVIQENGTLFQTNNISFVHEIINMAYYYSQDEYYQFDRLFLIVLADDFDYMYFVNVFYSDTSNVQILESKQQRKAIDREAQIFVNQNFIILYKNYTISILKNQEFNQILFRKKYVSDNNTVIYFDQSKEELFIFSRITQIYTLQVPFLSFASNESQGNFSIHAFEIDDYYQIHLCKVNIHFLQVSQSDNNTYFIFHSPQMKYYNLLQFSFVYQIECVSGPLFQAISWVSTPELGFFQDNTLQKVNQSIQSNEYYIVKAFSIALFQECKSRIFSCIFMVAVSNQNIKIYEEGSKSIVSTINITYMKINVTQIEITFAVLNQQLFFIICLSFGQSIIQIYQYNATLYLTNNITLTTEPFTQFQLLSDSVVLLQNTNSIAIITFDNKSQVLLNSKIFEETSSLQIPFNLINIFINQQYQSRVLYINNNNNFIIGYITEHLQFVLISIQNVIFEIENLLVVKNLLILSWIPQYQEVIYFEVWNVKNLTNPQYLKQMRSINFGLDKQSISYYSDIQFFYVSNNLTLNVSNPNLPGHSTLYYRIPYDGLYFTSIAIDSMVFLFLITASFYFHLFYYKVFLITLYIKISQQNKFLISLFPRTFMIATKFNSQTTHQQQQITIYIQTLKIRHFCIGKITKLKFQPKYLVKNIKQSALYLKQ
ncbi:unnamed protein product [Paramecium octaurelia]|uniref:Transmembrane protein n=1 Tax=Paramecium octaurelia TaxID=43137 RepID=A0A8S1W890_PAROT|nr:unnamed protein product [Paramecium octaurelia]